MRTPSPLLATVLVAVLVTAAGALLFLPIAGAAVPLGGLAVAVTPDGTQLVAGGDSRALYVLDPQTLAVKQRVHLGRSIVALAYSADGKRLWVESTSAVQMLDAAMWKVLETFENAESMSAATGAGLVAVQMRRKAQVLVLSMADGSQSAALPYDRMRSIAAYGLRPDGKQLALLYYRKQTDEEPKAAAKDTPKDLKGAALREFKQRNDGYQAQLLVFDVATGKTQLDKQLWYAAPGGKNALCWNKNSICVMTYSNQNARIDAQGKATYFELGNSYNYGLGVSADGAVVLSGGLRDGSRTTLGDNKSAAFRLDKLPGFPEYFKSFSLAADGTGYGGTSGWRVVRIDAEGAITKTAAVH